MFEWPLGSASPEPESAREARRMPSEESRPKRKRRWLRFSLRSFLVVLTIGCLLLGYWVDRAERQKAAVKWVKENGGSVWYDFQLDENGRRNPDAKPPGPEWMQAVLGDDYLGTVVEVKLFNTEVTDLTPLAGLSNLKALDIQATPVSDVKPLGGMSNLETLYLVLTNVSDVTPLAGLTELKTLNLVASPVSDVKPLAGLTNLVTLSLAHTQVTDLTPLSGLSNLEILELYGTKASDVKPLAGLTNLFDLDLNGTKVNDLTPLAGMTSLWRLSLAHTQVTDVMPLKTLPKLQSLDIRNTPIRQEQLDSLRNALFKCAIDY